MFWNSTSVLLSSFQSAISTGCMLETISSNTAVNNIAFNYVGKDILGQLGSLAIVSAVGKYIDKNPENFLRCSIILQQASFLVEASTPLFPSELFVLIAGGSNVVKCISFTGFGAINVKVMERLSEDGGKNLGEIYSKIASLNTVTSSIGMALGLWFCYLVPCSMTRLAILPIVGAARYYCFMKSLNGIITD